MEPESKTEKAMVETYAGDMAEVIGSDKQGLIKKIIHGEEEREIEKKRFSPESRQNKIFTAVSAVLFLLGAGLLLFFMGNREVNTLEIERGLTPPIFIDRSVFAEVAGMKKGEFVQTLRNIAETAELKSQGIVGIYPTWDKQVVGLRQFLALLESSFAPDPNPILVSDNFLMGRVNVASDNRLGFFILLQTRSTGDIFPALRVWERKMFYDLAPLLGWSINSQNSYLLTKDFEDGIAENRNTRELLDQDGNLVLMYALAEDESVVISDSREALREIMLRLAAKQKKE